MADFKLKLNNAGFRALRTSPEVVDFNRKQAESLAARCGPGYEVAESPSKNRSRFVVFPATPEAIADNARNNTLIRQLHG